jgi:hypothetical protein
LREKKERHIARMFLGPASWSCLKLTEIEWLDNVSAGRDHVSGCSELVFVYII